MALNVPTRPVAPLVRPPQSWTTLAQWARDWIADGFALATPGWSDSDAIRTWIAAVHQRWELSASQPHELQDRGLPTPRQCCLCGTPAAIETPLRYITKTLWRSLSIPSVPTDDTDMGIFRTPMDGNPALCEACALSCTWFDAGNVPALALAYRPSTGRPEGTIALPYDPAWSPTDLLPWVADPDLQWPHWFVPNSAKFNGRVLHTLTLYPSPNHLVLDLGSDYHTITRYLVRRDLLVAWYREWLDQGFPEAWQTAAQTLWTVLDTLYGGRGTDWPRWVWPTSQSIAAWPDRAQREQYRNALHPFTSQHDSSDSCLVQTWIQKLTQWADAHQATPSEARALRWFQRRWRYALIARFSPYPGPFSSLPSATNKEDHERLLQDRTLWSCDTPPDKQGPRWHQLRLQRRHWEQHYRGTSFTLP